MRRVTIDLTASATEELDRMAKMYGLTTADVFRYGLKLARIYCDARKQGKHVCLVKGQHIQRIEIPIFPVNAREREVKP